MANRDAGWLVRDAHIHICFEHTTTSFVLHHRLFSIIDHSSVLQTKYRLVPASTCKSPKSSMRRHILLRRAPALRGRVPMRMISETAKHLRIYEKLAKVEKEDLLQSKKMRSDDVVEYLNSNRNSLNLVVSLRNDIRHIKERISKESKASTGGATIAIAGNTEASANALYLRDLDYAIQTWMKPLFMPALLAVKKLDPHVTTIEVLENIVQADQSLGHQASLSVIKRRLFEQRSSFALFHILKPEEPLVIITANVHHDESSNKPTNQLLGATKNPSHYQPPQAPPGHHHQTNSNTPTGAPVTQAVIDKFIFVNNKTFGGLAIPNQAMIQTVAKLKEEHPSLTSVVIHASLHGFVAWVRSISRNQARLERLIIPEEHLNKLKSLSSKYGAAGSGNGVDNGSSGDGGVAHPLYWLAKTLQEQPERIVEDDTFREELKDLLIWLAYHYLVKEKIFFPKGDQSGLGRLPKDPTARFHFRNGASLQKVVFEPPSSLGESKYKRSLVASAGGLTATFSYDVGKLESRAQMFVDTEARILHLGREVRSVLGIGIGTGTGAAVSPGTAGNTSGIVAPGTGSWGEQKAPSADATATAINTDQ